MTPKTTTRLATINAKTKPQGRASNQHKNQNHTTLGSLKRQPGHHPDRANTTDNRREERTRRHTRNHTKHQEHPPNDNPHNIITEDNQQPQTTQIDAETNRNSTTTEAAETAIPDNNPRNTENTIHQKQRQKRSPEDTSTHQTAHPIT
eukprot:CAMPEP_0118683512 /NCGR_PEP_ID=MMETSP0800-20121206/6091_1 /TAXON_ID=210618 ORGANISM="Striatella unipunctata, Strain CCMP2910" /NCGR_SAMPLE_ID=MMETSP0800 /ASSEMBLY_ACC=CAM_ASM_000638 /LENGTH=147 /DNA_ID=CAMNT_0006580039 /DNA_START=607 /DNA_END=1050 /DNA_ORIENTATION=+